MVNEIKPLYEFGSFRVDPGRGVLFRENQPVRLTAKTFETLLVLIEHRQETVSKESLLETVWPNTFVEEANLTQHISMLRKALGETPQDRRYIVTVPGKGYRFVGNVRETGSANSEEDPLIVESHSQSRVTLEETSIERSGDRSSSLSLRSKVALVIAALVVLGGLGALRLNKLSKGPVLNEKDSILLSDFDNSTGDAVFDGALKEGLAAQLEQSPFLQIVGNDQVRETLRFMGRSPEERVLPPLAREVCQRSDARATITGSVARLGTSYVVALEAINCADARVLVREQFDAKNKEEALPGLGQAASELRRKLGESLSSIHQFDTPIEQATTPSLEALRAYSLGNQQRALGLETAAIPFFEHAIELDPNFAMAYAQLGSAYRNLGETEQAGGYFKRAFTLRGNLSERENLYVSVRYYTVVTGEIDKATDTYEMWTRIYPRDPLPFNGLAARYQVSGQYEKAAAAAAEAMRLQPNNYLPYANLAGSYMALNRFDEARQVCDRANATRRDSINTHRVLFEIAFLRHDQPSMQREISWAGGTDRENDMLTTQALTQISTGKLRAARQIFGQSWASSQRKHLNDDAAFSMAGEALAEADFGYLQLARQRATSALNLSHGIDAEELAAEVLALSGDTAQAQRLAADLRARYPRHTPLNVVSIPTILAEIELQRGTPDKAIDQLRQAVPFDLCEFASLASIYLRGQTYLRMRAGREAAVEFRKILEHPGIDPTSQRHPLAQLGLGRALALQGDTSGARNAYQAFLAEWADADADIPALIQAKLEYSRLR